MEKSNAMSAILAAGLVAGTLDITSAFILWGIRGVGAVRGLQSISSAAFGPSAFQGGLPMAALGLGFHFLIAFTATALFYAASTRLGFLTQQPFIWGPVYGVLVYCFMNLVVLPLSLLKRGPVPLRSAVIQIAIHMFCVGLPIAWMVRKFSR